MRTPEWIQPALLGAVVGAAAIAILGFTLGGWVTGSSAEKMAKEQSQAAVVAALTPICVVQSGQYPEQDVRLAALQEERYWQRDDKVMEYGWATMPGSDQPDRAVAEACLEELAKSFK